MAKPAMKVINVTESKEHGLTMIFKMDRKSLEKWAKILQVEGYKSTELLFPRKKKRGTMRRMRKMARIVNCNFSRTYTAMETATVSKTQH